MLKHGRKDTIRQEWNSGIYKADENHAKGTHEIVSNARVTLRTEADEIRASVVELRSSRGVLQRSEQELERKEPGRETTSSAGYQF